MAIRIAARRRTVLGGAMDGQVVTIRHGSTMVHAPSGDRYRRYGDRWWVPWHDSDEEAAARVRDNATRAG